VRDRIPVTSVARTLLDLAAVVDAMRLERAVEQAERLRMLDLRAVHRVCERNRGRPGTPALLALVASYRLAPLTRSGLERRFVDVCRKAGLPLPTINARVEGYEVDALWRSARLIVELDSWDFHRTRAAFERDRARDAVLQVAGYRVLRVSYRRLVEEPEAVVAMIRRLLR